MPIYEYECQDCKEVSEVLVFSSLDPKCPKCGSTNMKKLLSVPSSLTGHSPSSLPGPSDTGCCGHRPGTAPGCAGPGSCCGKA